MTSTAVSLRPVAAAATVWFVLALVAGATGLLAALPFPGPQVTIFGLTVFAIVAGTRSGAARAWVDALPLRVLVGAHAVRFLGVAFVVLGARGALAPAFASLAGWGDIVVATAAVGLALAALPATRFRWLYLAWNTFALLDLAVAVGTASWVSATGQQPGVAPLLRLPLSIVPTFFVPLFVAGHVFVYRRLLAPNAAGHGPGR